MTKRRRPKTVSLPFVVVDLTLASWETIARRTQLIAQNQCSPAEYQRMIAEKSQAALESSRRFWAGGGRSSLSSLLRPWQAKARANARRLRKK